MSNEDVSPASPFVIAEGNKRRRLAKRKYGQSALLAELAPEEAEKKGREALALGASAFYWLDGTELGEVAHQELHVMGRFVRESFGCELHFTGSSYEQRCPVAIAHKRFGLSIGFTGNRNCSICGQDVSECEHVLGREYQVPGGIGPSGRCRVCMSPDCNEHSSDQIYPTRAGTVLTEGTLHEVSIVPKPAHPDARLTAIPIDSVELVEYLGPKFRIGMPVICSQCLGNCPGFTELPSHERPIDG